MTTSDRITELFAAERPAEPDLTQELIARVVFLAEHLFDLKTAPEDWDTSLALVLREYEDDTSTRLELCARFNSDYTVLTFVLTKSGVALTRSATGESTQQHRRWVSYTVYSLDDLLRRLRLWGITA